MSINSEEFNLDQLRERLRKMSDNDLLRFGQSAKFMCQGNNPREVFVIQLREAREEWQRRHPRSPLNESN